MSSTVEELLGHEVAGKVIYRPQTYPGQVVVFGVLAYGDAQFHALDLQRHVHQSFSIALDIVEAFQVFTFQYKVRGMLVGHGDELLVQHVAHESHALFAVVVVNVAVNLVFVDILAEQLADDEEYLRAC